MRALFLIALFSVGAAAQQRVATGRITFVAGPTVYASLGRNNGLVDSSRGIIRSRKDTVAVLQLAALSSKSSSWSVERSSRDVTVGDTVLVGIAPTEPAAAVQLLKDTTRSAVAAVGPAARRLGKEITAVDVRGRVSLQYYGVNLPEQHTASSQPGMTLSLRAGLRDIPIQVVIYGTHRQTARGSLSPFRASHPETRLYRFSVEYDDTTTMIMAGRIYPMASPTVSTVDGISVGRRFGRFYAGLAAGLEPSPTLGTDPGGVWKSVLFAGYQSNEPFSLNSSVAYSRSYLHSALVREAASWSASLYTSSGFSIYGFSDIDLRKPMSPSARTDPSITSLMLIANARVLPMLSVYAGVDAARPVPSASTFGIIPDSLFDRTVRSGVTAGATVSLGSWNWSLSFSPRTSPAKFGKEYSGTTSVGTYDLLGTGFDVRATANMNTNAFTDYQSLGLQLHRNVWDIDWRLRSQVNHTSILQIHDSRQSGLVGIDAVMALTQSLSLTTTFDFWRGGGFDMDVILIECSWRF